MGIKLTLLPTVCHGERTRSENLIDHCKTHLVTLREMACFNHCVYGEVPPLESCKHVCTIILRCVIKKARVAFNLCMQIPPGFKLMYKAKLSRRVDMFNVKKAFDLRMI